MVFSTKEKRSKKEKGVDNQNNSPLRYELFPVINTFTSSSLLKIKSKFYIYTVLTVGGIKNVHNSLNDNGLLLMDLFYPNSLFDKSINGKWIEKEYKIDGQLIKIQDCRTIENDIEHRQQVFIINGTETKIDTKRKYFSPLTLKEMLISAGYHDIEFSYDYDYRRFKEMIDETRLKNNYIVKVEK